MKQDNGMGIDAAGMAHLEETVRDQAALLEKQWGEYTSGYHAAVCRNDAAATASYARAIEKVEEMYVRLLVWLNW